jgi:hypothetical protein
MFLLRFKTWITIRLVHRIKKLINHIVFRFNLEDQIIQRQREILSSRIHHNYSGEVAFGLFRGLKISSESAWSGSRDTGSKVLGLYESQILNWVKSRRFDLFIDIGAADSYYAMGLLLSKRAKRAITFEVSEKDRNIAKLLSLKMQMSEKIEILGRANVNQIIKATAGIKKVFILVDIEGEEYNLITPRLLKLTRNCFFLIEMHNHPHNNLENKFIKLCRKTHFVEILNDRERVFPTDRFLSRLTDNEKCLLMSEGRQYAMKWLVLSPKSN